MGSLVKSSAVGLQPNWGADTLVLSVVAPAAIARLGRWPSKGFNRNRDSQLSLGGLSTLANLQTSLK